MLQSSRSPARLRALLLSVSLSVLVPHLPAQAADGPPPIEFSSRGRFIDSAGLGDRGADVSSLSFGLSTTVPVPIAGKFQGSFAVDADFFEFRFHRFQEFLPGRAAPLQRGRIIGLAPSVVCLLDDKIILFAGPQWQFSGAERAATRRATQWSGSAGAIYQYRKNLVLVGGVAFAERVGYSAQVVPYAGFNWEIDDAWSLGLTGNATDYVAPVLKVARRITPMWSVFALGGLEERYLRLEERASIPGGTLRYEAGSTQLGVEWKPTAGFSATLNGGAQLAQKYTFKDRGGREVARDSAGASASFGFKLQKNF